MANNSTSSAARGGGQLPDWTVTDLPAPLAFTLRNIFKVIGPGAILAATSIGGGEWLVGPATAVKFGTSVMWIASVAIGLQLIFNLEAIRYTLYTGEPIYAGFMRLKPGSAFWGVFYGILAIGQLGWPALALSAAATLFGIMMGRLPGSDATDASLMHWVGMGVIVLAAGVLSVGGTIERMLERASWLMLVFIFSFLLFVNLVFVPFAHSLETLRGFIIPGSIGSPVDWALLGALVGTAASGGIGNLTITNWMRDKGFGMGAKLGAIESAVGGHHTALSPTGMIFPITAENLSRWKTWWKYVYADQGLIWALMCFVGLFLNVNLATSLIPPGTNMQGLASGAYQAQYMAENLWAGFWVLALLNGFWILFSTSLGNTDLLIRTVTDMSWTGSPAVRRLAGNRPGRIYYAALLVFSLWGFVAIRMAGPFVLFQILANMAGLVLAIAGVQIFIVNRKFLPRELRAPWWREGLLLFCSAFYTFFTVRVVMSFF